MYVIRLRLEFIKKSHKQVFQELRDKGIGVNLHYIPVHFHPYYKSMGFAPGDFPEAISIPIFYGLKEEMQNEVIKTITEVLI